MDEYRNETDAEKTGSLENEDVGNAVSDMDTEISAESKEEVSLDIQEERSGAEERGNLKLLFLSRCRERVAFM